MTLANKDFNLQGAPLPNVQWTPPSNFLGPSPNFLYTFYEVYFLNFYYFFQHDNFISTFFLHVLEWHKTYLKHKKFTFKLDFLTYVDVCCLKPMIWGAWFTISHFSDLGLLGCRRCVCCLKSMIWNVWFTILDFS